MKKLRLLENTFSKKYCQSISILILFLFFSVSVTAQTMGSFTDSRDGRVYKTVTIEDPLLGDGFTIMAENLNYKMSGSYAYDNDSRYRKKLGLLYTWYSAKSACPAGWHLPGNNELKRIIDLCGGEENSGKNMKSTSGWNEGGNGTNSSGFNGLPGGYRYSGGGFNFLGSSGYWWSSEEYDEGSRAYKYAMDHDDSDVYWLDIPMMGGCSVRCIKN